MLKAYIISALGCIGSFLSCALGGWDTAIITLAIFMTVDFATGIIVGGIFHKSKKTETGSLKSIIGFKGLTKKIMILLFVMIGERLDIMTGVSYIRDAVCIAYCVNELISIVENAGLMGVPIPAAITKAIDVLQSKTDEEGDQDESN